jgi:hypothetical protein
MAAWPDRSEDAKPPMIFAIRANDSLLPVKFCTIIERYLGEDSFDLPSPGGYSAKAGIATFKGVVSTVALSALIIMGRIKLGNQRALFFGEAVETVDLMTIT